VKFTLTWRCESGHGEQVPVDVPGREWAEELARVLKGKCGVCEAQVEVAVQ
jgi:hypothetical protein